MSDSGHVPQATTVGNIVRLKCIVHDVEPFLREAGDKDKFRSRELSFDFNNDQRTLEIMQRCNLVTVSREKYQGRNSCVYHWNHDVKAKLEDYRDNLDTLPCGHRAHVHNTRDGRFGCRYCDEDRDYPRELVESLL